VYLYCNKADGWSLISFSFYSLLEKKAGKNITMKDVELALDGIYFSIIVDYMSTYKFNIIFLVMYLSSIINVIIKNQVISADALATALSWTRLKHLPMMRPQN
jgi:hypothetical protein